jgi:hypothetical protein
VKPLNRGQRILLVIALICIMPLALALLMRYYWTPASKPILGELVAPHALDYTRLVALDGKALTHARVEDRWTLVYASPGACDSGCRNTLYLTRQTRTAQGKAATRLERLWVITDSANPPAELSAAHPDLQIVRLGSPGALPELGGEGAQPRSLHLVDRRGQVVMRYGDQPDPMKFIKELGRLIKF